MVPDPLTLIRHGSQARSLHDDPAFRRAFEKLYFGAIEDIRSSAPEEQGRREEAYWRLRTLEAFDAAVLNEIKMAEAEARKQDRGQ